MTVVPSVTRRLVAASLLLLAACLVSEPLPAQVEAFSAVVRAPPARPRPRLPLATPSSATSSSSSRAPGEPAISALSPHRVQTHRKPSPLFSSTSSASAEGGEGGGGGTTNDELLIKTSNALRRTSWLSWWSQVILTTISSVILLFARNIGLQAQSAAQGMGMGAAAAVRGPSGGFIFAGSGITLSFMSVLWTWGGARLSRRILRGKTTRISAANLTRRAIKVGASLNMAGMLVTLIGAFVIIGELATKVLTTQGFSPFGGGAGMVAAAGAATQTVQPLDILIVQGNFNTLLSHFSSLFFTLFLTRFVDRLDPPSTEDDPRD